MVVASVTCRYCLFCPRKYGLTDFVMCKLHAKNLLWLIRVVVFLHSIRQKTIQFLFVLWCTYFTRLCRKP
jgi:hypothetical protein